ncbi:MAG: pyruvate, water dikinase regulatory protein [Pseudomonadota bacterium]
MEKNAFHLHLISDATGETLNSVAKATCVQFDNIEPIEHSYALVRSRRQLDRVLRKVEQDPGVVMFTLMSRELRELLEEKCRELGVPCVPVLDPVLNVFRTYLKTELTHRVSGQHELDAAYFNRIEALNFTMAHDDGQLPTDVNTADVILVGVSRTSKTPTCIYLANRGIKAANIPFVPNIPFPDDLIKAKKPLVVGLTASPDHLIQIRRNRLRALKHRSQTDYVDLDKVRAETQEARRLFMKHGWPIIDVSRRSIEETAAAIMNLLSAREQTADRPELIQRSGE